MSDSFHMTPDEFRRHGHALIEWVASYMERAGELPVQSTVAPGEIRSQLPAAAPEEPEPFEEIMRDLDRIVLPGITHWQSPGWFAFFPANASPPSILAELVSAGLGVQGMLWATSPACTEIEAHVMDWLADLLGLPQAWKTAVGPGGGVIQSSTSDATHLMHVVAREAATRRGAAIEQLVAYSSSQAHSSVEKGARVAGFRHVRPIDVDERFAMRPDRLEAAIAADVAAGRVPTIVTSAIGTTGTAAVDPVRGIAEVVAGRDIWHHVDAAYAGPAMICPELREHQDGAELVDSYVTNPHKWMFTNFDCTALWVADRAPLVGALSILPPYLQNQASASGAVIDYRDWQVALGRRFRALKLWWVLRSYGARGIRHHFREHIRLAQLLDDRVAAHPRLERFAPRSFGLVCFRHRDGNEATDRLVASINRESSVYVTPSSIDDRRFIRVSIGQTATTAADAERLWAIVAAAL